MKHSEVIERIREWLIKNYPLDKYEVKYNVKDGTDFFVNTKETAIRHLQIEGG